MTGPVPRRGSAVPRAARQGGVQDLDHGLALLGERQDDGVFGAAAAFRRGELRNLVEVAPGIADGPIAFEGILQARSEEAFLHQLADGVVSAQAHLVGAGHAVAADSDALVVDQQPAGEVPQ